ncbi:hypothetical protein BpHYR1_025056 [Brachionus plicatilis]|uniref:Uncharacterized protein n=1 Tax=Brachionus plicatilis TaxID=10195 RepID=A0A3M7SE71_BRAPC|nr:hypothetical protein BpHYR1_025056 [Brachionus plicatilis]
MCSKVLQSFKKNKKMMSLKSFLLDLLVGEIRKISEKLKNFAKCLYQKTSLGIFWNPQIVQNVVISCENWIHKMLYLILIIFIQICPSDLFKNFQKF